MPLSTRFDGDALVIPSGGVARHVRNKRLKRAIDRWALRTPSPEPAPFYDQHRAAGDLHHQALRALGNRFVGILHGCRTPQSST